MKKNSWSAIKLITLIIFSLLEIKSYSQAIDNGGFDDIIEKIEIGEPSIPLIRFGMEQVYLIGRWCYVSKDSIFWTISRVEDDSPLEFFNGIEFKLHGKVQEYVREDLLINQPKINYKIVDDILEITIYKNDRTMIREQYKIVNIKDDTITLKKLVC
jgi:hypothetical protein